jgi:hypothetical protein
LFPGSHYGRVMDYNILIVLFLLGTTYYHIGWPTTS